MLPEMVDVKWQRKRGIRKVHVVAVLSALLAAGTVVAMFNAFGVVMDLPVGERQVIATVDLRVGTPALSFSRGESTARADIEANTIKLYKAGPAPQESEAQAARAERLKQQRHGIAWAYQGAEVTPLTEAWVAGYNSIAKPEIEKRHGQDFLDRLLAEAP